MSKEKFPSEKELNKKAGKSAQKAKKGTKTNVQAEQKPKKGAEEPHQAEEKKVDKDKELKAELSELKKKNSDLDDKFLRAEAEIQNMQNRYQKERAQLIKYESQNLAKDILPAMDDLERALSVKADDKVSKQLQKGVQMTLDALVKAMKQHGITEIEAQGKKFDPTLHQAVQTVAAKNDDQKEHVVQVLQKGYQYKDRTLRPAMVVVAQ